MDRCVVCSKGSCLSHSLAASIPQSSQPVAWNDLEYINMAQHITSASVSQDRTSKTRAALALRLSEDLVYMLASGPFPSGAAVTSFSLSFQPQKTPLPSLKLICEQHLTELSNRDNAARILQHLIYGSAMRSQQERSSSSVRSNR